MSTHAIQVQGIIDNKSSDPKQGLCYIHRILCDPLFYFRMVAVFFYLLNITLKFQSVVKGEKASLTINFIIGIISVEDKNYVFKINF